MAVRQGSRAILIPNEDFNFCRVDEQRLRSPLTSLMQKASQVSLHLYLSTKYRVKTEKPEWLGQLPNGEVPNVVVACNHSRRTDICVLSGFVQEWKLSFLAKQELYGNRISRFHYYHTGTIAVDREFMNKATFRSVRCVLREPGWSIAIFPEGTRANQGKLDHIKPGAAMLAARNQVPLLPIGISYHKDNHIIAMVIGDLIHTQGRKREVEKINEELLEGMRAARQRSLVLVGSGAANSADKATAANRT